LIVYPDRYGVDVTTTQAAAAAHLDDAIGSFLRFPMVAANTTAHGARRTAHGLVKYERPAITKKLRLPLRRCVRETDLTSRYDGSFG